MEMLQSIGIDSTIFVQLFIFCVSFIAINNLAFKPYLKAYEARKKRTVGNQALAEQALEETKNLEMEYESKAKALNREHKSIYDSTKTDALHEFDEIVKKAREQAAQVLQKNRTTIQSEVNKAKTSLTKEIPEVGASIATKLLGKEIST